VINLDGRIVGAGGRRRRKKDIADMRSRIERSRILGQNRSLVESNGGRSVLAPVGVSQWAPCLGADLTVGVGVVELPVRNAPWARGVVGQGRAELSRSS